MKKWKFVPNADNQYETKNVLGSIMDDEEMHIARIWEDGPDSRIDAHLISAAPELLEELAHLVRLLEPLEQGGQLQVPGLATLNGARVAIAKAKGEAK